MPAYVCVGSADTDRSASSAAGSGATVGVEPIQSACWASRNRLPAATQAGVLSAASTWPVAGAITADCPVGVSSSASAWDVV